MKKLFSITRSITLVPQRRHPAKKMNFTQTKAVSHVSSNLITAIAAFPSKLPQIAVLYTIHLFTFLQMILRSKGTWPAVNALMDMIKLIMVKNVRKRPLS